MNVSEDVQPGFDSQDGFGQLLTSHVRGKDVVLVKSSERRPVRDEHGDSCGDLVPIFRCASLCTEGPLRQNRRYRTPPKGNPLQSDASVFQVNSVREVSSGFGRAGLEEKIVIPGDDDPVSVRQGAKPFVEIVDLLGGAAVNHEVPGVDQDVRFGQNQLSVEPVRVADAHDAHLGGFSRISSLQRVLHGSPQDILAHARPSGVNSRPEELIIDMIYRSWSGMARKGTR